MDTVKFDIKIGRRTIRAAHLTDEEAAELQLVSVSARDVILWYVLGRLVAFARRNENAYLLDDGRTMSAAERKFVWDFNGWNEEGHRLTYTDFWATYDRVVGPAFGGRGASWSTSDERAPEWDGPRRRIVATATLVPAAEEDGEGG